MDSELLSSPSIRKQTYSLLDQNPHLSARMLAKMLDLSYNQYKKYLWTLKTQWKTNYPIRHGSKCSSHAWRGWTYLPKELDVNLVKDRAIGMGWVVSGARNRFLLWKDYEGRLQLFETGRVNLYVRKPANLGRASQLLANGLYLVLDNNDLFERMRKEIRFKGAHYVFDAGVSLPKMVIDVFDKTNGITIKLGDRSDPHGVEVLVHYPDWSEKVEKVLSANIQVFTQLNETLKEMVGYSTEMKKPRPASFIS